MTIVNETITPEAQQIKTIILERLEQIDRKKEEVRAAREMLTSAFENSDDYRKTKEEAGKQTKKLSAIKERIKNENPTPTEKLEELKDELKDLNDGLGEYLGEFVRMTGKMELTKHDGTEVKIVRRYKTISPGQQRLL